MSRERFWGLYDLDAEEWLTEAGDGQISDVNRWSNRQPTAKKVRFLSAADAKQAWQEHDPEGIVMVIPRPFYVVHKPKKPELTPRQNCGLLNAISVLQREGYVFLARDLKTDFNL